MARRWVVVECHAGVTTIRTPMDAFTIEREVEAVLMSATNIRTIERSADGAQLYEVIYALGESGEVIDISRDTLATVTIGSLSR